MQGGKLDLPIQGLIAQDLMQAWDEVIQILVHPLREIRNYTAGNLGAVVFLRLQGVFNVVTDVREVNLVSKAHNHAIEGDESILSDFLSLLEKRDDHLDHVVGKRLLNSMPDLDQNDLHQATKRVLQTSCSFLAQIQSGLHSIEDFQEKLVSNWLRLHTTILYKSDKSNIGCLGKVNSGSLEVIPVGISDQELYYLWVEWSELV